MIEKAIAVISLASWDESGSYNGNSSNSHSIRQLIRRISNSPTVTFSKELPAEIFLTYTWLRRVQHSFASVSWMSSHVFLKGKTHNGKIAYRLDRYIIKTGEEFITDQGRPWWYLLMIIIPSREWGEFWQYTTHRYSRGSSGFEWCGRGSGWVLWEMIYTFMTYMTKGQRLRLIDQQNWFWARGDNCSNFHEWFKPFCKTLYIFSYAS